MTLQGVHRGVHREGQQLVRVSELRGEGGPTHL